MKRIIIFTLTMCVLLAMALASPLNAFAAEGNTVLVMNGTQIPDGRELEIVVSVEENSGVSSMLLSLEYDTSVFTLTDLTYGSAFSSLAPVNTNTDTEEGYGAYPFKITYLGDKNDTSTGTMMTLRFKIKEDAPDGSYNITLKYDRNKDVAYLENGRIQTKNLLIDGARITLENNTISKIETYPDAVADVDTAKLDTVTIIIAASAALLTTACAVILLTVRKGKNKKKWIKL